MTASRHGDFGELLVEALDNETRLGAPLPDG